MSNPEKIEIASLKTIHKLCNFGADHNMEGCTFTEIVERMFSKIEQMKTQVNTLDEMLLNQGEALAQAKAQAVPEGFVLVPVKEIKTWYLDDSEGIYREDPEWLCDIPVGEVVEVEHRVSYELDQDPVFAAIQWDEENSDVGYYETFKSKVEAEKVAAHCKAMVEAQEQTHD
ncbi:hypothetical protein [Acinetobacter sp. LUNF3]|uniref:hypothetical protein n=1 Tax=Acinetobacter sp. LUNF3 TaxID=2925837 RepID=UPI001F602441|nr:hypothetical protein [Acinetobacter sp. LUNF3]UNT44367.1 hypothetical protein MN200_06335 [Acinetobacter sp. LUNF3]